MSIFKFTTRQITNTKISSFNHIQKTIVLYFLFILNITFTNFAYAEDAKIIKDVILFKDHSPSSPKMGGLKAGKDVRIIEKAGFWIKVQSSGQVGWVKLSDIQLPRVINNIDPIATGRNAKGNIVNTAGARGLSPEDLKNSQPNPLSVDIAIQNASQVKDTDVSNFIISADLIPRASIPTLHSVKTTMTGNAQQGDEANDDQSNTLKKTSVEKKDPGNDDDW